MCIVNRLSEAEVEEFKKELPEEFTAYRCIVYDEPLFRNDLFEPNSTIPGLHKAGYWPSRRMSIEYKPGFHVFQRKKAAEQYGRATGFGVKVLPIIICKLWIEEIGSVNYLDLWRMKKLLEGVFVCSYIKVEE